MTTALAHPERLDELPAGTRAVVQQIDGGDVAIQRLMAMGLCVGRELEIVRHGNPLIVRLLSARIGISGRVAHHIHVFRKHH
jgi:Fe2+ transport system protein FeoA